MREPAKPQIQLSPEIARTVELAIRGGAFETKFLASLPTEQVIAIQDFLEDMRQSLVATCNQLRAVGPTSQSLRRELKKLIDLLYLMIQIRRFLGLDDTIAEIHETYSDSVATEIATIDDSRNVHRRMVEIAEIQAMGQQAMSKLERLSIMLTGETD